MTKAARTGPAARLTLAAAQLPACGDDAERNVCAAEVAVREAAAAGAELVLLPELATVPYFCSEPGGSWRGTAEPVPGPLSARFGGLARELGIAVALPLHERDARTGDCHNSVVVLGADGAIVPAVDRRGAVRPVARKLHLPVGDEPAPGCDEAAHFTPGGGLGVHDLGGIGAGVLVCYDRRFPECWRELRALGGMLALVPVAGDGGDGTDFFLSELRTHARENGIAALVANKVGTEWVGGQPVNNFGESCLVLADGEIVARREEHEGPGVLVAELDVAEVLATRRRLLYFDHRRTDLFGGPDLDGANDARNAA